MTLRRHIILSVIFVLGVVYSGCAQQRILFKLDWQTLNENREDLLEEGETDVDSKLQDILVSADAALMRRPRSVTEKDRLPPSGDKRDFLDEATYWWPDPEQPDGLPYIHKDGQSNPERATDFRYLNRMAQDVHLLGLAWYYTNEEKYAEHATELLRVWFLNETMGMNPNLNYVAMIPGRNQNLGRGSGLIRTRVFVDMLDGVQLITSSEAWSNEDHQALQKWFRKYMDWMQNSKVGQAGRDQPNNIGTAYDMQLVCYALFIEDEEFARTVLTESVPNRMDDQFDEDGSQPYELRRTRSWGYSISNLNYWFTLARLAEHVGFDLWRYESSSGRTLLQAVEYLQTYAEGRKEWEYENIRNSNYRSSFRSLEQRIPEHVRESN